ncbi:class II aldolase/adducin family protein [Halegenticoccus tardaugens]|uniref:class II aldolase/adducin family protein n=1 Tax=Halegenticoccus tardaugens TaxID=2071624 RepID=UPI00100A9DDC|nr:class II aldolase/adducin family protein [Halegenticoccus tardaugens]
MSNQEFDPSDGRNARESISDYGVKMLDQGLTKGTGGNISALVDDEYMAISPSGVPYEEIADDDVPILDFDGTQVFGSLKPSAEHSMHAQVYRERDDVGGVVHNHSPYASTFASISEPIEASHYLIAFAGDRVPVAPYETYGTEALGAAAVETLGDEYDACLLENHGVLAVGDDVASAFETALMVEYCARIHFQARAIGEPTVIPDEEIERLQAKFAGYGQNH